MFGPALLVSPITGRGVGVNSNEPADRAVTYDGEALAVARRAPD